MDVSNAKAHKTTTVVDPAFGSAVTVTDPNNNVTDTRYDALGRLTTVWLPNRPRTSGYSPNITYAYSVTANAPSWVSTSTINGLNGAYNTTYEIFDALLRPRQTQTPSAIDGTGRVISETLYDDRGLAVTTEGDIYDDVANASGQLVGIEGGQAPAQTDVLYDGAGRAATTVAKKFGNVRWSVTATYTGDTVATTAPGGGSATAVVTNALGQTTQRREYAGDHSQWQRLHQHHLQLHTQRSGQDHYRPGPGCVVLRLRPVRSPDQRHRSGLGYNHNCVQHTRPGRLHDRRREQDPAVRVRRPRPQDRRVENGTEGRQSAGGLDV